MESRLTHVFCGVLELFDCDGFISDIRGNRTCKIQPVKGHLEVLKY